MSKPGHLSIRHSTARSVPKQNATVIDEEKMQSNPLLLSSCLQGLRLRWFYGANLVNLLKKQWTLRLIEMWRVSSGPFIGLIFRLDLSLGIKFTCT